MKNVPTPAGQHRHEGSGWGEGKAKCVINTLKREREVRKNKC